jgi:hypothetical protein
LALKSNCLKKGKTEELFGINCGGENPGLLVGCECDYDVFENAYLYEDAIRELYSLVSVHSVKYLNLKTIKAPFCKRWSLVYILTRKFLPKFHSALLDAYRHLAVKY